MNCVPLVSAAADIGGGNITGNVFQKIDGGAAQLGDELRGRVAFPLVVGTGQQIGWNYQSESVGANAGAVGDDEIAEAEERFVFLPHGNVEKSVGADDEINSITVTVVVVAEVAHGIHGVVQLVAGEIVA